MRVLLWFPRSKELFVAALGLALYARLLSVRRMSLFAHLSRCSFNNTHLSPCPFLDEAHRSAFGASFYLRRFNHAFDLLSC